MAAPAPLPIDVVIRALLSLYGLASLVPLLSMKPCVNDRPFTFDASTPLFDDPVTFICSSVTPSVSLR